MNLEQYNLATTTLTAEVAFDTIKDMVAQYLLATKTIPDYRDIRSIEFNAPYADRQGRVLVPVQYTLKERAVRHQQNDEESS